VIAADASATAPVSSRPACLACGADALTLWATARDMEYGHLESEYQYLRCPSCASLSISPVPREQLHEIYPPNYYSFESAKRSLIYRIKDRLDERYFKALLASIPGGSLRVMDVGGGDGEQLDVIRRADPRVTTTEVVDIDADAEQRARAKGHEYYRGRIENYDRNERFDFVLLLNVIEHVDAPEQVLRTLGRLLSPTGRILVKTPNIDSLDVRLFRHRNWGGFHCPRHWVLFNRSGFEALVRRSGLRVREFRYTQGAPFWAMSVLFVMSRHGLARITPDRPATSHPLFAMLTGLAAAFDIARGALGAKTSQMFFVLERADTP